MYRGLIILFAAITILNGCRKTAESEEDQIKGTWIRQGTSGSGPANTLYFSEKNSTYTLSFDCSGSPGPNWPANAATEYKFQNGKLSYLNYADNSLGFYTANSFIWVTRGQEFEVQLREMLLFMAATYVVRYKKVN